MTGIDTAVALLVGFCLGVFACASVHIIRRIDEEEGET